MPSGITPEFLEDLKSRCDIVRIAQKYMPVERKGSRFWARCPFHHEKTASFMLDQTSQFYHCFGCGVSGDVIGFVRAIENVDFFDAVRLLCEDANIPMPELKMNDVKDIEDRKKRKDRLLRLMKDTANFYYKKLLEEEGRAALTYLQNRGVTPESRKAFALGYSPDLSSLVKALSQRGYTEEEMISAGVVGSKNGRVYDFLTDRLIYPIVNSFGDVIAFGGRSLEKKPDFAKYKNTGDTPLFNKKQNLYAINLVKAYKREQTVEDIIVVEGYMDVIALHQAGFRNTVASMGTALTKEQARMLKRYADKVYICYDGDAAGQKGAIRGMEILAEEGLKVFVVSLPDGLDPDELIKERGKEAYRKALSEALPLVDFKLLALKKEFDVSSVDGKRQYALAAVKVIALQSEPIMHESLLRRIHEETGFMMVTLQKNLDQVKQNQKPEVELLVEERSAEEDKNTDLLRVLLYVQLYGLIPMDELSNVRAAFTDACHLQILSYLDACCEAAQKPQPTMLFELLDPSYANEIGAVLSVDRTFSSTEQMVSYAKDVQKRLVQEYLEKAINALSERATHETDPEVRKNTLSELVALKKQLRLMKLKT